MNSKKRHDTYRPPAHILDKYADILVNFSLNQGKGLQPGEVVNFRAWPHALPMREHILKHITQAGGRLIDNLLPINQFQPDLYRAKNIQQFQEQYALLSQKIIQQSYHEMLIVSDDYSTAYQQDDPELLDIYQAIKNTYNEIRGDKLKAGTLGYNLSYYPTPSMADAAGLTLQEYRQEIIHACFLDEENPIDKWKEVFAQIHYYRNKLSEMAIESLHVVGEDVDLTIRIGADRKWLGGTGRNMPSYEIFVSPDRRGTQGWINFSEPLYENGKLIDGIKLVFKNGKVTQASAKIGEELFHTLLQTKNFDKIGEFSLTDKRHSRITKFMANTLYDENRGGVFGNNHIALGDAYKDSYCGDYRVLTPEEYENRGFNSCGLHVDMVSTNDRIVIATLANGAEKVIYKNGQFTLDI